MAGQTWLTGRVDFLRGLSVDTLILIIIALVVVSIVLLLLWVIAVVKARALRLQLSVFEQGLAGAAALIAKDPAA